MTKGDIKFMDDPIKDKSQMIWWIVYPPKTLNNVCYFSLSDLHLCVFSFSHFPLGSGPDEFLDISLMCWAFWLAASFYTFLTDQTVIPTSFSPLQESSETSSVLWRLLWPQDTPAPIPAVVSQHPLFWLSVCLCPPLDSGQQVLCLSFLSSNRESGAFVF